MPAVLEGKSRPKDGAEWLSLRGSARDTTSGTRQPRRFFAEAFAAAPELAEDRKAGYRYNAACTAALAGCGQGKDTESLDAKGRVRLRGLALGWLRGELKAWQTLLDLNPANAGPTVAGQMQHWLADTDFAGVRGSDAVGRLPEAERSDWRKLWEDADALRRRCLAPAKPPAAEGAKGAKASPR